MENYFRPKIWKIEKIPHKFAKIFIILLKTILMNKGDLINKVQEGAGLTKAQATDAVKTVLDSIGDCLKDGDKVSIVGFGTFSVAHRAERQGRNPATGAAITISAKNNVKFKAGKELTGSVN
ncbi:MAG: DNA-binding protein HU-beta [Paraglaciecola sp.]